MLAPLRCKNLNKVNAGHNNLYVSPSALLAMFAANAGLAVFAVCAYALVLLVLRAALVGMFTCVCALLVHVINFVLSC